MPIKVAGIVGSPHKDGMTAQLVRQALAGAEAAGELAALMDACAKHPPLCLARENILAA